MIVQTIHEILNPFDVHEQKHGYGVALFMIAGSIHSNPQFIVRFYDTGILRTCDQNDLVVYGNPTAGEKLTPESVRDTKEDLVRKSIVLSVAKSFRKWQVDWDRFSRGGKIDKPISFDEFIEQLLTDK